MRQVKRLFDPKGLLNPGVMVDAEPLTVHLRDAEYPQPKPLKTHFDFPEGSMHAAADRCQRIGACRKTGSGVMCPSYMATREEEHATRGRANALVKALGEPDPARALGDERLHEILDLCLECKACKSECPLSVDMATHEVRVPRRTTTRSTARRCARGCSARSARSTGSAPPPRRSRTLPLPRRLMERVTGIARRRPLPRFERETLIKWAENGRSQRADARRAAKSSSSPTPSPPSPSPASAARRSSCSTPRATTCAWRAPAAAGARRSPRACSTTPRRRPRRSRERLAGTATITGVEPSCLLTLREEHVALIGDRGRRGAHAPGRGAAVEAIDDGALTLRDDRPAPDPLPRPLPPEGARGHRGHGRAAAAHPRRRGRGARRRLLRHGRLVRLRGRALRTEHAHRRDAPVPGGPRRSPRRR